MNTTFTIKNFRIFDEDGETFDLKPLTILTGCNSSGKSSVVKGLSLLCEYFAALKEDKINGKKVVLTNHDLDFSKRPNNLLGRFNKVVNRDSDSDTITFRIRVHSLMLAQDVDLELGFSVEKDAFNGVITSVSIKKLDGTLIFESTKDCACRGNLYSLLPEFLQFSEVTTLLTDYESESWAQSNGEDEILGTKPMREEDYVKFKAEAKTFFANFKKEHGRERLIDFNKWRIYNNKIDTFKDFNKKFPKVSETGILYYLPILDNEFFGDKAECLRFLDENIKKNEGTDKDRFVFVLQKIVAAFKDSKCQNFKSFYRNFELQYLSNFYIQNNSEIKCGLFDATLSTIKTEDLTFSHESCIGSWIFDDTLDESQKETLRKKNLKFGEMLDQKWRKNPLNFTNIFSALVLLSEYQKDKDYHKYAKTDFFNIHSMCLPEQIFFQYIEAAIEEIVVDNTPNSIKYISSSIINVKRLYPVEADDEFTSLLKRYLYAKRNMDERMNYVPGSFLNRWIDNEHFDLGSKITIDVDKDGLGITLRLHQDENDAQGSLLADSGYGITQLFAILLNIEVAIMERTYQESVDGKYIIVNYEDVIRRFAGATLAIEEPEIHLHPNFQAKLAEMFTEAYKEYGINFIIETHSEYLIRKLQTLVLPNAKDKQVDREDISIIYINSADVKKRELGEPHVKQIGICANGFLDSQFGTGFFDQALSNIRELQNQNTEE